jgi:hypothetical protein
MVPLREKSAYTFLGKIGGMFGSLADIPDALGNGHKGEVFALALPQIDLKGLGSCVGTGVVKAPRYAVFD